MSQLCLLDASTLTPVLKLLAAEALDGVIIGRNEIPSPHKEAKAFISRKHLSVSWDPNMELLLLSDNGSPNGTYVNGVRVRTATLKVGDVIQVGGAQSYEFGRYYRKWPPWSWKLLVADIAAETMAMVDEGEDIAVATTKEVAAGAAAAEPLPSRSAPPKLCLSVLQSPDCIATLRSPPQQQQTQQQPNDGGGRSSVRAEGGPAPCYPAQEVEAAKADTIASPPPPGTAVEESSPVHGGAAAAAAAATTPTVSVKLAMDTDKKGERGDDDDDDDDDENSGEKGGGASGGTRGSSSTSTSTSSTSSMDDGNGDCERGVEYGAVEAEESCEDQEKGGDEVEKESKVTASDACARQGAIMVQDLEASIQAAEEAHLQQGLAAADSVMAATHAAEEAQRQQGLVAADSLVAATHAADEAHHQQGLAAADSVMAATHAAEEAQRQQGLAAADSLMAATCAADEARQQQGLAAADSVMAATHAADEACLQQGLAVADSVMAATHAADEAHHQQMAATTQTIDARIQAYEEARRQRGAAMFQNVNDAATQAAAESMEGSTATPVAIAPDVETQQLDAMAEEDDEDEDDEGVTEVEDEVVAATTTAAGDKRSLSTSSTLSAYLSMKKVKSEFAYQHAVTTGAAAVTADDEDDDDVIVLERGFEEPTVGGKDQGEDFQETENGFDDDDDNNDDDDEDGGDDKEEEDGEDEDEEKEDVGVELISSTGGMLCDFPHSREHCTLRPFVPPSSGSGVSGSSGGNSNSSSNARVCSNCYCYVCDAPASVCPQWWSPPPSSSSPPSHGSATAGGGGGCGSGGTGLQLLYHCNATCKAQEWRDARASRAKEAQLKAAMAAAEAAAKAATVTTTTMYTAGTATAANNTTITSAAGGAATATAATDAAVTAATAATTAETVVSYSLQELLRQVEQVYPEEEPEPQGLAATCTLRPYQRQSLAFALNAERQPVGADQTLVCPPGAYAAPLTTPSTNTATYKSSSSSSSATSPSQPCFGGWIADEMGMGKTAVVIALVLANPFIYSNSSSSSFSSSCPRASDEAWSAFEKTGRHTARPKEWVKASPPGYVSRGLTPSQILAAYGRMRVNGKWCRQNPAYSKWRAPAPLPRTRRIQQQYPGGSGGSGVGVGGGGYGSSQTSSLGPFHLQLKATLVLTSVSLLGQWEDEFRRYAPGLVVRRHFGAKRWSREELGDWRDADVILSSMAQSFEAPHELFQRTSFHRIVLDESHGMNNHPSFLQLKAKHRWACTGTPVTMSIRQLEKQARFLGQLSTLQPLLDAYNMAFEGTKQACYTPAARAQAFLNMAAALRRRCIRHTKAMRMGGSVALALPDETCSTVVLTMSSTDAKQYESVVKQPLKTTMARLLTQGGKSFSLEMGLSLRRHVCARAATKLAALRRDLMQQRDSDQAVHAVVFTSFKDVHKEVVDTLKHDGFDVFQFSGGTDAKERHASIRAFQQSTTAATASTAFSTGPAASFPSSSSSFSSSSSSSSLSSSSSSAAAKPPTKVFVITLRAGAVGLTLTAASTVYLMEPSIDPAVEVQAAGRIHRLGQTKEVLIKRFVFKNTIEEAVCEVHAKIKAGEVAITDSLFPASMVKLLCSK